MAFSLQSTTMAASYPLLSTFPFVCLCFISFTKGLGGGFTVELIHRDSPKSPYYNSSETPFQQVAKALRRSINRASHFYPAAAISTDAATTQPEVIPNKGEYLMSFSIGTPPREVHGIADTGSDLIWLQCKPCIHCYNQTSPTFDPSGSTTYKPLPCNSQRCQSLKQQSETKTFCSNGSICGYGILYRDVSFSIGDYALDTLSLSSTNGGSIAFPETLFGCGHNNGGTYDEKESGVIGLGGGALSLINQMGSSTGGKFSYCLVPFFSQNVTTSTMNFGENASVSGSGTVSTPIIRSKSESSYYLSLQAISVGPTRLEFADNSTTEANIIIDSGTTLTLLPTLFYDSLQSALAAQVKLQRVDDPTRSLGLCYNSSTEALSREAPAITAHFHGADVQLNPINTLIRVSEQVLCFAFGAIYEGAIFGNMAQMNFLVGYDLQKNTVSFKPTDCTKL